MANMPNALKGNLLAIAEFTAFAYLDRLERPPPVGHNALPARVPYHKWAHTFLLCRIHQVAQLLLIHRGRYGKVGYTAHVGQIISPMMGRAVGTGYARAIEAKYHVQVLDSHIVYYLIISPLHKSRIDISEKHGKAE